MRLEGKEVCPKNRTNNYWNCWTNCRCKIDWNYSFCQTPIGENKTN